LEAGPEAAVPHEDLGFPVVQYNNHHHHNNKAVVTTALAECRPALANTTATMADHKDPHQAAL